MKISNISVEVAVINTELPTWNEAIAWAKIGGQGRVYAGKKKNVTNMLSAIFLNEFVHKYSKIALFVNWGAKTRRKDPDNVASGIKFILDGLVKAEVIPDDRWANVVAIQHGFFISKPPRIQLAIAGERIEDDTN